MLVSIFTPTHKSYYLNDAWESIKNQTYQNFEWVVLLNNGATWDKPNDDRVKVFYDTYEGVEKGYVGRLKGEACDRCIGDILFEMDHDDWLEPTALEETVKAFEDEEVVFTYSNSVNVNYKENGGQISGRTWNSYYGWTFRPFIFRGVEVYEAVSSAPDPQAISRIWFAPNHLRAYRTTAYRKIGGYDKTMKISDDHDIGLRMYLEGKIKHIDKPLYIYRVDGDNTWLKLTAEIQTTMWSCYDKYILPMMKKRSKERNLKVVDLGGALGKPAGFESVDRHNADIVTDLSKTRGLADNSLGYVRAHHILEHLEPIHAMNELWRCCAHGAIIDIEVPSDCGLFTGGKYFPPTGNRSDPTHISSWNERSFRYYTERTMRRYIQPECTCMFNVIKPAETVLKFDNVPCVKITLMAEKGGERIYGSNDWRGADGKYL